MLGQVAIINGVGHALAAVKAHNAELDAGGFGGALGNAAHVHQAGAGGDAQFHQGDFLVAVPQRRIGGEENGKAYCWRTTRSKATRKR